MTAETAGSGFDCVEAEYDHALAQGISISGEDRAYFVRGRVAFLRTCLGRVGEQPVSILDFGCGSGGTSAILRADLGARAVVGVDASERLLTSARQQFASDDVRFLSPGDLGPDASFDLAYCNGVFHHIPVAERTGAARYVHDALRPGGYFALWDNNPWSPAARYVMSRIPFDRDARMIFPAQARLLLRAAGFEIVRVDFLFIFPRMLRALRVFESPLSKLPLGAQYQVLARRPPGE